MSSEQPEVRKKSLIKEISEGICGHCRKPRGQHSKKNMLRCLYTSDYNLYHAVLKIQELESKLKESAELQEESKKIIDKEVKKKRKTKKKTIESKESENLNAQAVGKDPDDVR